MKNNSQSGIITNIQRFSIHDGPGIRTTVFLKGCNLHCYWCHNPESIESNIQLQYNAEKCIDCGFCSQTCPISAHTVQNQKHIFNRNICKNCGKCTEICCTRSLTLVGQKLSYKEVFETVFLDKIYYDNSNGGITLSGGEPLLQHNFCLSLLSLCKEFKIHTAIESHFSLDWKKILAVIPVIDLFIIDIKTLNEKKHKDATGSSNKHIIENIEKLSNTTIPFIIRTPIIPGFNDSSKEIEDITKIISKYKNLLYYELLPYNNYHISKRKNLGISNHKGEIKSPSNKKIEYLYSIACKNGINIQNNKNLEY